MTSTGLAELDLIEELRLRRWARENYVPAGQRDVSLHPVILDEMARKDREGGLHLEPAAPEYTWSKS
jgi:hypothetical protein